jgi:hypothetical protein
MLTQEIKDNILDYVLKSIEKDRKKKKSMKLELSNLYIKETKDLTEADLTELEIYIHLELEARGFVIINNRIKWENV